MIKVKATLGIGFCGAYHRTTLKFEEEEFEGMSDGEKQDHIYEAAQEWANNYIELYCDIVEEEETLE